MLTIVWNTPLKLWFHGSNLSNTWIITSAGLAYQLFKHHTKIMYRCTCWGPNLTLTVEKFKKLNHFNHSDGLLRHQRSSKNYKRPMKIVKAKSKAREWPKTKFQFFFTFLGSLGVFYCMISMFLSFEVIKAKKATLVAGAAFLF